MAKQTQAAKRHRQSLVRRDRNFAYRSRLRTFMKRARQAIDENSDDKKTHVDTACRELDRMVTKGVMHKNTASRSKSRLVKALTHATEQPA